MTGLGEEVELHCLCPSTTCRTGKIKRSLLTAAVATSRHHKALNQGQNLVVVGGLPRRPWGQIMKRLTGAQLFSAPKSGRKTKARLARAKSLLVEARERAAVMAQRYAAHALARPMPLPTLLQRRRLAERLNANS